MKKIEKKVKKVDKLPEGACAYCKGTGKGVGDEVFDPCNFCKGTGKK